MAKKSQKWLNELDVLIPFTKDNNIQLTATMVAKSQHLPQRTAARHLQWLADNHLITYKRVGRQKYFSLTDSYDLLLLIESYKALNFLRTHKKLRPFLESLDQTLIIFGSYARGDMHNKSDLDLLILGKKSKSATKALHLSPVDVHPQWSTLPSFMKLVKQKHHLALEILKDHIILGPKENLIKELNNHYRR